MAHIPHRFLRDGRGLPSQLEEARVSIKALAEGYGLDFFETIFEMCSYEEINMLASYGGFPNRYPHWRYGMEYLEMQKSYEYGLSKIYEMVINTDPSYAYLMDCNLMVDQKLVMAHVYGHVDFFKNNLWFAQTNRKMLDQMANHGSRVRKIIDREGITAVEAFIDVCLSIDNLVDPYADQIKRSHTSTEADYKAAAADLDIPKMPAKGYMDKHINPPEFLAAQAQKKVDDLAKMASFPEDPERDVMGFILQHGKLPGWKRDILSIVRDEALYFAPQGQTKIMNEGWATYWHTSMMTRDILTDSEVIDYCDHHSGTVAQQPGRLNPYKMGVELLRDIERRWDKGQFGKDWLDCKDPRERARWDTGALLGKEKLFQVRHTHNDITFLDTFLTPEFCREQGFFTTKYDKKARSWVIDSREFAEVKQGLLGTLASRGTPRVYVVDGNHNNRGELRLAHAHEGKDIQLDWASMTLQNLTAMWGRPVHLETFLDGKPILVSCDGTEVTREDRPTGELDESE
ncbi:MAG: SpoVR family protein [Rhodobacterales bacterium]|nr:SpoVR family protein [Rhodobacterales bacterium]